jgi:hypothetical protein
MGTKFNLNRQPVPDEEINSHKDFGELVNKFKKQSIEKARSDVSFLKNKKATYSAIIAGVAVICTVTYFSVFKQETSKQNSHDKIITLQSKPSSPSKKLNSAFIAPPVKKLNVPYTSYKVKAEQGATIKHKTNSKIIIPKKAFVNKQGQDIIGDVELEYREFHNQADIIASGIPMSYDSAGVKSTLESAGMIDIRGYQNGDPVFINPKKQITIEFKSEYTADKYNMYVLDTIAKNWMYVSRDNSLRGEKKSEIEKRKNGKEPLVHSVSKKEKELQKQLDAIPPKIENEKIDYSKKATQLPKTIAPSKPIKVTAGRPQFKLEVNYNEFPELAAYKNAVFEVGTENKNYISNIAEITWGSAEISEGIQKGKNYLLTLKLGKQIEKLIVYPALAGADYDKALKSYESKFNDYRTIIAKREADEKKLKEEFEAKQTAFVAEQKIITEQMIKERIRWQKEEEEKLNTNFNSTSSEAKVVRIFKINSFGICNSDCPENMPTEAEMHPIFTTKSNSTFIRAEQTYLICQDKNLVFNFGREPITYNPKNKYIICVMSNNKLYVCEKETFAKCVANKENKIPMKEISAEINDAFDLKMALGI